MLNKSVFVLAAIVTIGASVTAAAAVSVAATPISKTVAAMPIGTPVSKAPGTKVVVHIPATLNWSCTSTSDGGLQCTDPRTGKTYACLMDPSNGLECEVGSDYIPGSY